MKMLTNFDILVFKIWSLFPYRLQIKFFVSLFLYLFTIVINLWHQKFVTADVIAVFFNKQHGIQRRGQDVRKKFVLKCVHSKEADRQIS